MPWQIWNNGIHLCECTLWFAADTIAGAIRLPSRPLACGWDASGSSMFETNAGVASLMSEGFEDVDGVERFFIAIAVVGALGFVATLGWMLIFH